MSLFQHSVLAVVRDIPAGTTCSYGEVAAKAGFPGAARAVGTLMAANADLSVPCHRVVCADGSIGPYNGLRGSSKKDLLISEGVCIDETGKIR